MTTGLGDFWRCIDRDIGVAVSAFLDRFDEYEVLGPVELVPAGCGVDGVVAWTLHTPLIDAIGWLGSSSDGNYELVSHYPTVVKGCGEVKATVISYEDWPEHVEGLLRVNVEGKELTVFDSLFPASRESYEVGGEIGLSLYGLGFSVRRMSDLAEVVNDDPLTSSMVDKVYETGESWIGHSPDAHYPDDLHMVVGQLVAVEDGDLGPMKIYRASIKVFPDVVIPIVYGATSIETKDFVPVAGSWVCMMVFLQGYRTGLARKRP